MAMARPLEGELGALEGVLGPLEGELGPLEVGVVEGVSDCSSTNSFNIFCRWNTSLVFSTGSRFS